MAKRKTRVAKKWIDLGTFAGSPARLGATTGEECWTLEWPKGRIRYYTRLDDVADAMSQEVPRRAVGSGDVRELSQLRGCVGDTAERLVKSLAAVLPLGGLA